MTRRAEIKRVTTYFVYTNLFPELQLNLLVTSPITLGAAGASYIILIYWLTAIYIDLDRISLYSQN